MVNEHQAGPRISVVTRDPQELTAAILAQPSYGVIAKAIGVSKTYIGELAQQHRDRVSLDVAVELERVLGVEPGGLFRVHPETAERAKPYLT